MTFESRRQTLPAAAKDYTASGATTITTVTTAIPGLSHSFTAAPNAIYYVVWSADVSVNTAGTINIVEALFDGVAIGPGVNTSGPSGLRAVGSQFAFLISPSAAAHTVTVQSRNAAGGSATVNQTHTRLAVWRIA
jgi:hypothetical protein